MLLGFAKGLLWPWVAPPVKMARWVLVTAATGIRESWAYVNKPPSPRFRPPTPWDGKFTTHEEKTPWGQRWKIRYPSNLKVKMRQDKVIDKNDVITGRSVNGSISNGNDHTTSNESWQSVLSDGAITINGFEPGALAPIEDPKLRQAPGFGAVHFLQWLWKNEDRLHQTDKKTSTGQEKPDPEKPERPVPHLFQGYEKVMEGFPELTHGWQLVPGMSENDAVIKRHSPARKIGENVTIIDLALRIEIGGDSPGWSYWWVRGSWMTDVGPAVPIRIEEAVRSFVVDRPKSKP